MISVCFRRSDSFKMNQVLTHILCCGDSDEDEDEDVDGDDDCVVPVASGTSAYKTTRSVGPACTRCCSSYVSWSF